VINEKKKKKIKINKKQKRIIKIKSEIYFFYVLFMISVFIYKKDEVILKGE